MIRVAAFFLVACCGCGGEMAMATGAESEPNDGASEVLYLLASSPTGVTTRPLLEGVTYKVVIRGTVGLWRAGDWSSVCAGKPSSAPRYSSPGATGPAAVDAEWVWAWPSVSTSLCPNGVPAAPPPQPRRLVLFRANSEAPPGSLPPPLETGMTASHAYTYSITGAGTGAVFVVDDTPIEDNYGALQIRIIPP